MKLFISDLSDLDYYLMWLQLLKFFCAFWSTLQGSYQFDIIERKLYVAEWT